MRGQPKRKWQKNGRKNVLPQTCSYNCSTLLIQLGNLMFRFESDFSISIYLAIRDNVWDFRDIWRERERERREKWHEKVIFTKINSVLVDLIFEGKKRKRRIEFSINQIVFSVHFQVKFCKMKKGGLGENKEKLWMDFHSLSDGKMRTHIEEMKTKTQIKRGNCLLVSRKWKWKWGKRHREIIMKWICDG